MFSRWLFNETLFTKCNDPRKYMWPLSVASRPFLHNQTPQDYHSHFSNTLCKSSMHPCLLTMLGCLFKGEAFAILPNINSHRKDIKIYEAVTCYVWSNEKVAFQSEGKQLWAITVFIFYMLVLHERKFVEKINWIFSNNWIYQANVTRLFLLIIESGVKKYITRWNFFLPAMKKILFPVLMFSISFYAFCFLNFWTVNY